jgi:hypothetical protein
MGMARKREWHSKSVKALLRASGYDDPIAAILSRARQLISESGLTVPPFPPRILASLRGVKDVVKVKMELDGLLISLPDGFIIKVNADHSPQRQNFSINHEIAHTFFLEYDMSALRGKIVKKDPAIGVFSQDQEEEYLCDIAAAELLMPMEFFKAMAKDHGLSIKSIQALADIFDASVPAVVRRLAETNLWECVIVIWKFRDRPGSKERKLRIDWSIESKGLRYYIPRHKPIDENTSIFYAYETGLEIADFEILKLGNLKGRYCVESARFGHGDNKYVVSIIFLDGQHFKPPLGKQLALLQEEIRVSTANICTLWNEKLGGANDEFKRQRYRSLPQCPHRPRETLPQEGRELAGGRDAGGDVLAGSEGHCRGGGNGRKPSACLARSSDTLSRTPLNP